MFGKIPEFNDGLEFLRKLWGNATGMPAGMMPGLQAMTPPMDLEEIDKRIHDLKAVESWLQLNASLVRTTIQGLEVQRATLVALQTFGNALSPEAIRTTMENVARAATAPSAGARHSSAFQARPAPGAEGIDEQDIADMAEMESAPDHPEDELEEAAAPEAAAQEAPGQPEPAAAPGNGQTEQSLPPQAALWWDMMQQQFNQIASSAAAASLAPFGNLGAFGGNPPGPAAQGAEQPSRQPGAAPQGEPDSPAPPRAPSRKASAPRQRAAQADKASGPPAAKSGKTAAGAKTGAARSRSPDASGGSAARRRRTAPKA